MRLKDVKERLLAVLLMLTITLGGVACGKGGDNIEPEPNEPGEAVIVATFNVRYNNPNDGVNIWSNRRDMVANVIKNHKFDIFGVQEPYFDQLNDMVERLPDYAYVGRSRTNQTNSGEFVPIFYHKDRIEILESDQFWLTDAADRSVPSVGWDAGSPRICTWAKVRHKIANETFYVFNVHYAHDGSLARMESTKLMMEEAPRMAQGYPYFLLGDFNYDQNSAPYQHLRGSDDLVDTYGIAKRNINGNRGTLNSFNPNSTSTGKIDHIFVNKQNPPTIKRHQIITDSFSGRTPSDHFPVLVEVIF
ncbi:MAG TPA: endonuclease/exonuclease/phosphatase family protein [Sphingobacterium sp.]|jgi:endonuclease/exonuclease/phosphatase family metal-dependent hydrolase|nr:endonuclease/exonuclease/phosphatase family protein [Sphingobacterium sp.]